MNKKRLKTESLRLSILRKRWPWIVTGIAVFLGLSLALMPLAIKYNVRELILDNGGDEVRIEDIDFNPFTGKIALTDLTVKVKNAQVLHISEAIADLTWFPFFQKHIQVQNIAVNGLDITIETLPEGRWRLGGVVATLLSEPEEDPSKTPWGFGLRKLNLLNSRVNLQTDDFESTLEIDHLTIARVFSWQPETVARVELSGRLNGSPLKGWWDVTPFSDDREATLELEVADLSLKPFIRLTKGAVTELDGKLTINASFQLKQSADHSLKIDKKGVVRIQQTHIITAGEESKFGELIWNGSMQIDVSGQRDRLNLMGKGDLQIRNLLAKLPQKEIVAQQKEVKWSGDFTFGRQSGESKIEVDGELGMDNLMVSAPADTFNKDRLSRTERHDLSASMLPNRLTVENTGLVWKGTATYARQLNSSDVYLKGMLDADTIKIDLPDTLLSGQRLKWKGDVHVKPSEKLGQFGLIIDGLMNAEQVAMKLPQNELDINHENIEWKGQLNYGSFSVIGDKKPSNAIVIRNFDIADIKQNYLLFNAAEVHLNDIAVGKSENVSGSRFQILNLELLKALNHPTKDSQKSTPLIGAKEIVVEDFSVALPGRAFASSVSLDSLKAQIRRKKDGTWNFIEGVDTLSPSSDEVKKESTEKPTVIQASEKTEDGTSTQIKVKAITITGDSVVSFEDESVDPSYRADLRVNEFSLVNLNSFEPDQSIPFKIDAKIGKHTDVNFKGNLQPFTDRVSMEVTGKINDLEMPPLSSYTINAFGHRFASGETDIDIDLKISQGQLAGEGEFKIYKLELDPLDKAELKERNIKSTIPLDSAISLLRNGSGDVKLKVPISGDIADPKFSIADAINQAVLKATKKATLTYLKYALWPYGTAIAAVELAMTAADKVSGISLDPVIFEPGRTTLTEDNRDYINKLAGIMKERPVVRVQLCGLSVKTVDIAGLQQKALVDTTGKRAKYKETDKKDKEKKPEAPPVTKKNLEDLARERAKAIENILVSKHGIDNSRIFICHPKIETVNNNNPRVELIF
ncbi:MAG: DUF748 domain-containing protein [Desulfobacterales bacterium]|nr:MAG: DUF748 domain-containing protein [Desulfobacterales bacterium]